MLVALAGTRVARSHQSIPLGVKISLPFAPTGLYGSPIFEIHDACPRDSESNATVAPSHWIRSLHSHSSHHLSSLAVLTS